MSAPNPFDKIIGPENVEALKLKSQELTPERLKELRDAIAQATAKKQLPLHIIEGIKDALDFVDDFKKGLL